MHKHLRLVLQPTEGGRVDDAVPVVLIAGAGGAFRFRIEAATAVRRPCGIRHEGPRRLEKRPNQPSGWSVQRLCLGISAHYIRQSRKEREWKPRLQCRPAPPGGLRKS